MAVLRCGGVRVRCLSMVLAVVAVGCGGDRPQPTAQAGPRQTSGVIPPTPAAPPHRAPRPVPRWVGWVPQPLGDQASGPHGRAWVTHGGSADLLWLQRPGAARQLVAAGGGVMEGSDDLHSPLWVGARLIWADSHAWDGSNYDSSV